jgi:hypothetical protein
MVNEDPNRLKFALGRRVSVILRAAGKNEEKTEQRAFLYHIDARIGLRAHKRHFFFAPILRFIRFEATALLSFCPVRINTEGEVGQTLLAQTKNIYTLYTMTSAPWHGHYLYTT